MNINCTPTINRLNQGLCSPMGMFHRTTTTYTELKAPNLPRLSTHTA